MTNESQNPTGQGQTIIINQLDKKSNGIAIAGFVLAIIGLLLGWVPILGWIVWLLGLILSLVGVFKTPRGLAIAGLVISFIGIILLLTVFAALLSTAAFHA